MEAIYLGNALHNVFAVEVAKFYFRNIFRLNLVKVESFHEVWHNVRFLFRFADYFYSFVYVEKYFSQTEKQMKLFFLFAEVKRELTLYAAHAEAYPFCKNFPNTHGTGRAVDENIGGKFPQLSPAENTDAPDLIPLHQDLGKFGVDHGVNARLLEHFVDHDPGPGHIQIGQGILDRRPVVLGCAAHLPEPLDKFLRNAPDDLVSAAVNEGQWGQARG